MKVSVTWEDIRAGKPRSTSACIVALALKRELGLDYVSVATDSVRLGIADRYVTLHLPREVERKIRFWELFHFVLPFSFEFQTITLEAAPAARASAKQAQSAEPWEAAEISREPLVNFSHA